MGSGKDPIANLVAAVADGTPVDWDRIEHDATPAQRGFIEQLRLIATLFDSHKSLATPESDHPKSAARYSPGARAERRAGDLGRWGDVVLIEEVGRGSYGAVYRAHDPRLDRPVAVKLLQQTSSADDAQLESKLLHEGRTLARVQHPGVVKVYRADKHDGRLGLEMEFVRGLTLEEMLASHGPFSAGEASLIGFELCGALAAVHIAGLVHRDVKAQNVMREEGGRLVLMDFGAGEKRSSGARTGKRVVGTPLYLAPEVLKAGDATMRSDIYSLGVLLYHLVTNDFPVRAATLDELRTAHTRGHMTPLVEVRPQLPRDFVRIVERATDPDPSKRYATASRMEAALAQVLGAGAERGRFPRLRPAGHAKATRAGRAREPGPSVAVLPFSDMSPAKDQESFCDGIAEELISALTHIAGLRVAARASTFQFKGQARDVRQIGDALGVATVLDGSVRKDGDRLRITVELIGSADGYHLWSECFDRRLIDVFAIQHEIAAAVVSALRVRLTSKAGPIAPPRNTGVDVYELYLEGRYRWNKRTEGELTKSVGCFARAVERDPQFAPAYAGMADAYLTLGTYGALPPRDVMPRATDALERALALDPTSAEAYTCRGCLRSVYEWAWADAERDYLKAIALNPSYSTAHHWLAINHLVPLGRFDEATGALRVALTLDPLALAVRTSLGMKCYFAGQYDEAVRELSKTIELDAGFGMAHFFLGATYTELGAFDDASRELEAAVRLSGRSPELLAAVGYMYGRSGDATRARLVVKELEQLARSRYVSPAKIAQVLAGIDERDTALARLADAHREHAADLAWVAVRPVFQNLHNETGFVQLLQALQLADS